MIAIRSAPSAQHAVLPHLHWCNIQGHHRTCRTLSYVQTLVESSMQRKAQEKRRDEQRSKQKEEEEKEEGPDDAQAIIAALQAQAEQAGPVHGDPEPCSTDDSVFELQVGVLSG